MKIEITVKRPSGEMEVVDMSSKISSMNKAILSQMREATRSAGRGYILKAVVTSERNNMADLAQAWNNTHNEGGFGAVPSAEDFRKSPNYREWVETETYV